MPGSVNNDDILTALNQVIQAVNDLETATTELNVTCTPEITVSPEVTCSPDVTVNCGGTVGGGPIVDPPPVEGQDPEGEGGPGGGGLPPGFEGTIEEYNSYKCAAANLLVDTYIQHVTNYQDIGSLFAVLGVAAAFSPLPDAFIAIWSAVFILILFGYLVGLAVGFAALFPLLGQHVNNLIADKAQFVCDLYEAQDVDAARTVIETHIGDTLPLGIPISWIQTHVDNMFPNNVLNILFENYAPAETYQGSINCQTCGCEYDLEFITDAPFGPTLLGSGNLDVDGESRVLTAVQSGNGNYYLIFQPVAGCCNFVLTIDDIDVTPVGGSVVFWHNSEDCADQTAVSYRTTAQVNDEFMVGKMIGFASQPSIDGGPFTITVTLSEPA